MIREPPWQEGVTGPTGSAVISWGNRSLGDQRGALALGERGRVSSHPAASALVTAALTVAPAAPGAHQGLRGFLGNFSLRQQSGPLRSRVGETEEGVSASEEPLCSVPRAAEAGTSQCCNIAPSAERAAG